MSHLASLIDLHCHSTASDGSLTPSELIDLAHKKGVRHLALTDHDTVSGLDEAVLCSQSKGVNVVSGVEFSAQWNNQGIHILGLHFNRDSEVIKNAASRQEQSRFMRAQTISDRLAKKGFEGIYDLALAYSGGQAPGRPHMAAAMVEKNYVSSVSSAFKKYLGAGKIGDVKSVWPELEEVVKWIVDADGVAVIAHPRKYNMTVTKLRSLIEDFKAYGGEGLEVITSGQKQGEIGLLADLCLRYDLKGSIGSDFHTPAQPWVQLGAIPSLPKSVIPVWSEWRLEL
ncbi:PHP domain-containing protein [Alkalimarinus sediminis]|uniref:PHP domain-containing protein n=1 Tax=Alkalimarinus sediminis TaxID=1632866 RepID=A0A9E8KRK6_9ALTE|nr:PHP domain-containing protein [Alkalimarinus sediminis]UZW76490.1 PHP domain-containing protein [Alkalimarinus sediminis]